MLRSLLVCAAISMAAMNANAMTGSAAGQAGGAEGNGGYGGGDGTGASSVGSGGNDGSFQVAGDWGHDPANVNNSQTAGKVTNFNSPNVEPHPHSATTDDMGAFTPENPSRNNANTSSPPRGGGGGGATLGGIDDLGKSGPITDQDPLGPNTVEYSSGGFQSDFSSGAENAWGSD